MAYCEPRHYKYVPLRTEKGEKFIVILLDAGEITRPGDVYYFLGLFDGIPTPFVMAMSPPDLEPDSKFEFFGKPSLKKLARSEIGFHTEWQSDILPPIEYGPYSR